MATDSMTGKHIVTCFSEYVLTLYIHQLWISKYARTLKAINLTSIVEPKIYGTTTHSPNVARHINKQVLISSAFNSCHYANLLTESLQRLQNICIFFSVQL